MNHRQGAFRTGVLAWHQGRGRSFPWRESDDLYEVLVAEVLLQRTRGEHVLDVYREFLRRWPTPSALGTAREKTIARVIRPLGLASRARTLKELGRVVSVVGVPSTPEELLELPGVGPYGAHAVPVFAAGAQLPLVDWVIARVLRRYFGRDSGSRPNADSELWALAARLVSVGRARDLWLAVLDFGAEVCKPRPLCVECPLRNECALGRKSVGTSV